MSRTTAGGRIAVTLELHPPLQRLADNEDGATLREWLRRYVEDLLEDLRIPVAADTTLRAAEASSADPEAVYRLTLNGRGCQLQHHRLAWADLSAKELGRLAAADLCRNRGLLLTPSLVEHIGAAWTQRGTDVGMPGEALQAWLADLIERGCHIERALTLPWGEDGTADPVSRRRVLEEHIAEFPDLPRLEVLLGRSVHTALCSPDRPAPPRGDDRSFPDRLDRLSDVLFTDLGLVVAPPAAYADPILDPGEFRLRVNDLRWPPADALGMDEWLTDAPVESLAAAGIGTVDAVHPLTGDTCSRVHGDDEVLARCREAGSTLGAAGFIASAVRAMARRHAGRLLTSEAVRWMLDALDDTHPALVRTVADRYDPTVLTWILRDVLVEEISIRDLRGVLEGLLTIEGSRASALAAMTTSRDADVTYWSDWARVELKRQISHRHLGDQARPAVYLLAQDLEARIAESDTRPLSDDERHRLLRSLLTATAAHPSHQVVVLTTQEARRRLRRLLDMQLPGVAVVSYQELSPDVNISPIGRIGGG